jgi:phage/plasmid-like protein (TIGR03299 family)
MVWDASELVNGRMNRRHNLNVVDGRASMFYAGELPWHELGQRVDSALRTWDEVSEAAGLGFEVGVFPLAISVPGGVEFEKFAHLQGRGVDSARAVVRVDTGAVLGSVGRSWKPVQNKEAFGFLDSIAADRQIEYHTAGALGAGERIWLLAKLPGVMQVASTDDEVERYLLLSNAHDGSAALRVLWTPQRVVCQNTLAVALAGGEGQGIAIRHSGDLVSKVREAQRVLGLAERFYDDLKPRIDALAGFQMNSRLLANYFEAIYPDPEDPEKSPRAAETAKGIRDVLTGLFEGGIGHDMPGIKGTAWCAYNAVTEFIDHDAPTRKSEGAASRKLESMWWGSGAKIKREAWSNACELAECV